MEKNVIKPVTVSHQEFVDGLSKLINGSNLPYFIVSDVLRSFLNDLKKLERQQYKMDLKMWENYINENNLNGEKVKEADNQ